MTIKAHIYAEDGALLGYIAYNDIPPKVLEVNGRYFEQHGKSVEGLDEDDCVVIGFDYWEICIQEGMNIVEVCMGCGRNSSIFWHKCCPEHTTLDGPDVLCQSCVEMAHPGEVEFQRV